MPLTPTPEPCWIVGPVTWDEVHRADSSPEGERLPGGTALYTARASEALGVQAHVLAQMGDEADLSALGAHEAATLAARTLTFRHDFPSGQRVQTLIQETGRSISPDDVPDGWPEPATLILAPLLPEEIDVPAFLDEYPGAEVALLAQGLQRAVLPDRRVAHRAQPTSVLLDAARANVSIFLSEDEVALWPAGALAHLAARAARVVVTRGGAGARVLTRQGERTIASMPVEVVDATGAGDVFATAFILGLRAGEEFAGRLAAACAAVACEVRGPGVLPSLDEIAARFHLRAGADEGPPA